MYACIMQPILNLWIHLTGQVIFRTYLRVKLRGSISNTTLISAGRQTVDYDWYEGSLPLAVLENLVRWPVRSQLATLKTWNNRASEQKTLITEVRFVKSSHPKFLNLSWLKLWKSNRPKLLLGLASRVKVWYAFKYIILQAGMITSLWTFVLSRLWLHDEQSELNTLKWTC